MGIQNFPASLQPIIQQGFLEREFQQALRSKLGYRAIADRVVVPVRVLRLARQLQDLLLAAAFSRRQQYQCQYQCQYQYQWQCRQQRRFLLRQPVPGRIRPWRHWPGWKWRGMNAMDNVARNAVRQDLRLLRSPGWLTGQQ